MAETFRTLVAVPTYNEIENLPRLVDEIFRVAPHVDVLVIDDNSPDGTGQWCDRKATEEPRLRCLHRPGKQGLGTATIAGMRYAIEEGYEALATLDADFSHPPRYLPDLLAGVAPQGERVADVMIGSRYVAGGGVEGWPLWRRWVSRWVNRYARLWLGLRVKDCSGAFRCYRVETLRRLDLDTVRSRGYSYLEEILWRLERQGARLGETPIVFFDRERGRSKINVREGLAALWVIARLGVRGRLGR